MDAEPVEGVVKFTAAHREAALPDRRYGETVRRLIAWREMMVQLGLIGQDPGRYDGAGYGNVSGRVGPFPGGRGARAFVVTGTQTGGRRCMGAEDFCVVTRYDAVRNHVESHGPAFPSSESMTHGAIYDIGPSVRWVLHAHCPLVWRRRRALALPTSSERVAYGTPEMAREVERLHRETRLPELRIFAMGGHEDGIVVYDHDLEAAGATLFRYLARAYEMKAREDGGLCTPPGR